MKNYVRFKITEFFVHCVFLTYVLYGRLHLKISFLCFLEFFWLHLSLFLISFLIVFAQQISLVCRRLFNFSHAHEERPRGRESVRETHWYLWEMGFVRRSINSELHSAIYPRDALNVGLQNRTEPHWALRLRQRLRLRLRLWLRPQLKLKSKSTSAPAPPAPQSDDWAERERMLAAAGNVCVGNSTGIYLCVFVCVRRHSPAHMLSRATVCVLCSLTLAHIPYVLLLHSHTYKVAKAKENKQTNAKRANKTTTN